MIAKELDTDNIVYAPYSFETGEQFRESIDKGLDETSLFVLIASRHSITSDWVNYESDEANARYLAGRIRNPIVFIVDEAVTLEALPKWLVDEHKAIWESNPKLIAHEIRRHLEDLAMQRQDVGFIGRGVELDRAKAEMRPIGEPSRKGVFVFGIVGIGKRTFLGRLFRDVYQLKRAINIRVSTGDTFADAVAQLADIAGAYTTRDALKALITRIQQAEPEELHSLATEYLTRIINNQKLPLFVDDGGLIDNDGVPTEVVSKMLEALRGDTFLKLGITTFRRAQLPSMGPDSQVVQVQLNAMTQTESLQLLSALAERYDVHLTRPQFEAAADWTRGHPWTARYAIELIKAYGFDAVEATAQVASLRQTMFIKELDARGLIPEIQRKILRTLAEYAPLPAPALVSALGISAETFYKHISSLVDRALVIVETSGYRVADPVVDAILQRFRRLPVDHFKVHQGIRTVYLRAVRGDEEFDGRILEIGRLAWLAATAANSPQADEYVHLASDAIRAAQKAFHARRYDEALKLARYALTMRGDDVLTRSLIARSLARMERFGDALNEIDALRTRGHLRDYYYLLGYVEQIRGRHSDAAQAFRQSISHGRSDASVYRDLAESLLYTGQLSDARHYARQALARQEDSAFILDLLVRIAIKQGDIPEAEKRLVQLSIVESGPYFEHRSSVVRYATKDFAESATHATAAYSALKHVPEVVVQYVTAMLSIGELAKARSALSKLRGMQHERYHDVLIGLEVQLLSKEGHFEDAMVMWDRLKEKDKPVSIAIRCEALLGFVRSLRDTDPRRAHFENELRTLNMRLEGVDFARVVATEVG